jgi:diguanylate cyclase (GGDEF)-like protein
LLKLITARSFTAAAVIVSGRRAVGRESDTGPGSNTWLLNASTWERKAAVQIARAVRTGSPSALALVDIDHFKVVNDAYGHLVRDKALRAVTDVLHSQLRNYDLAGRFGEEGFAVLLPCARGGRDQRGRAAERAHRRDVHPGRGGPRVGQSIKLTISVWITALDGARRELTDMIDVADAALYYAKETGRNRTHVITALTA